VHLAIGLVEGIVTAGVVGFIMRERPEIMNQMNGPATAGAWSARLIGALAIAALLIGGASAWVASENPDGLEWSMEKVAGSAELAPGKSALHRLSASVQEALSFMPDYQLKDSPEQGASSLPGIVGSLIVLAAAFGLGLAIRRRGR